VEYAVFDTRPALADMASQIRSSRATDGLTLQQLASRSGVAASTIQKIEAQQMVPTVSVLLKIAKGLGRRPQELIRDEVARPTDQGCLLDGMGASARRAGVWRIELDRDRSLPIVDLDSRQHAIVVVEKGVIELRSGEERVTMAAGDCIEFEGGRRIESAVSQTDPASVTLIVSPPSNLDLLLGGVSDLRIAAS